MDFSNHHAHLFCGDIGDIVPLVEKSFGVTKKGNPDFLVRELDTFGIDDARDLAERQSRRAINENVKIFIVSAQSVTTEAQNALLKVFEEPTKRTHFFLLISSPDILLPTLRSRMETYSSLGKESGSEVPAREFLSQGFAQRMDIVSEIIENKDKASAQLLLDSIEVLLFERDKQDRENIDAFQEISKARKYLRGKAPSLKMILENLSIFLPVG